VGEPFRHRLRVRYAECDPQGIVFNSRYLEYFDVVMTELWRAALGPYEQVMKELEVDLVVAEATVRYRSSLRFDDEFDLLATVRRLGGTGMTTAIEVRRADGVAVAEGELRHVFVDPDGAGKRPIPERVRGALLPHHRE
jgi:acyl-CoA thioester hydrolase